MFVDPHSIAPTFHILALRTLDNNERGCIDKTTTTKKKKAQGLEH